MHQDFNAAPVNPLPWIVWALALPMIALEAVIALGASGLAGGAGGASWRVMALEQAAILPDYMRFLAANEAWVPFVQRLVSYPFVSGNLTQAIFAVVLLLALGKAVGEVFRWWALALVFFASAVVGALAYLAIPGVRVALIGGYPAVYGVLGAFTFLLWVNLLNTGGNGARAFTLIGMLMAVQLLFGALFGGSFEWVADLSGFATGFVLSFLVSPGGFERLRDKLRRR